MDYPLCKNLNFAFFLNPCLYCLESLLFKRERHQILFLGLLCITRNVQKISNFSPKPWTNPFGKMLILWFFDTDVFVVQKVLFAIQNVANRFFTIYVRDLWHGNTGGYKGLLGVTRSYRGLQGVTRGYRELQRVTRGDRGWQKVTGGNKGLYKLFSN